MYTFRRYDVEGHLLLCSVLCRSGYRRWNGSGAGVISPSCLALFSILVTGKWCILTGASPGRKQWGGQKARVGLMASAEREPITGVWGQSPQRGPGAEPLVRGQGAPPEAESILPLDHPYEGQSLPL